MPEITVVKEFFYFDLHCMICLFHAKIKINHADSITWPELGRPVSIFDFVFLCEIDSAGKAANKNVKKATALMSRYPKG